MAFGLLSLSIFSGAAILVSIVGVKVFRTAFSEISRQHMILILSVLFFNFDYRHLSEGLPLDYFIAAILFNKVHTPIHKQFAYVLYFILFQIYDLYLKTYFMLVYILPGSWSHPFHIVIQPLLIPRMPNLVNTILVSMNVCFLLVQIVH